MGKTLQSAKGICVAIFRFKHDRGFQFIHQTALAGDTEFGGKICMDTGNDLHREFLCHSKRLLSCFLFSLYRNLGK